VRSPEFAETEESRRRLQDLALGWQVRAALRLSPRTRDLRVSVAAAAGRVTLSGVVDSAEEGKDACEVAAAVPGVREIEDKLRSPDSVRPRFQ
jgi:osmotically-inducible protein OsmY